MSTQISPPVALVPSPPGGMSGASRRYHCAWLILAVAVLGVSFGLQPPHGAKILVPFLGVESPRMCGWWWVTGFDCPGCGLTRSLVCLAHGAWARAWDFNPAGLLVFGVLLGQIPFRGVQLWRLSRGRAELRSRFVSATIWLLMIAILTQWIARIAGG